MDPRWSARYGSGMVRGVVLVGVLVSSVAAALAPASAARAVVRPCAPPLMLWAWERPERLDGIDPTTTGVAFLARTIVIGARGVTIRPRLQPLTVPPATYLVAVVRVEHAKVRPRGAPTALPAAAELATAIAAVARPGIAAVQVDFDAARSERRYYGDLLRRVRAALPPATGLTMTALASWALGDAWLDGLPVDDAVPMLFRMGADDRLVRRRLAGGGDFRAALARRSLGLAVDEPTPAVPPGRRLYLFNPRPWTLTEVQRWPAPTTAGCSSAS